MSSPLSSRSSSSHSRIGDVSEGDTSLSLGSVCAITEKSMIVGETSTDTDGFISDVDTSDLVISDDLDIFYDSEPESSFTMETVTSASGVSRIASDSSMFTVTKTEDEADSESKAAESLVDVQDADEVVVDVTKGDATGPAVFPLTIAESASTKTVSASTKASVNVSPTSASSRKILIDKADMPIKTMEEAVNDCMASVEIAYSDVIGIINAGNVDPLAEMRPKLEPEDDAALEGVSSIQRRDLSPVGEPKEKVTSSDSEDNSPSLPYGFLPSDEEELVKLVKKIGLKPRPYEKVSARYAEAYNKRFDFLKAGGLKTEETKPASAEESDLLSDYDTRVNPSSDEDDYSPIVANTTTVGRSKANYRLPKPFLEVPQESSTSARKCFTKPQNYSSRRGYRNYQDPMLKRAEILKAKGLQIEEIKPAAGESDSLSDYDTRVNPSSDEDDYSPVVADTTTRASYRMPDYEPKPFVEVQQESSTLVRKRLNKPQNYSSRRGHRDYKDPAFSANTGAYPPYNDANEEAFRQWQAWQWQHLQAQAAAWGYYGPPYGQYQPQGPYQQHQAPPFTRPYHLDSGVRISQYYPESRGHRTSSAQWSRFPPPPSSVPLGEDELDSFNGPYYHGPSYRGYYQQPQGLQRGNYSNRRGGRGGAFNDQSRELNGRYSENRGRPMANTGGQRTSSFISSHAKLTKKPEEKQAIDSQWYDFQNSTGPLRLDPRMSGSTRGASGPSGREPRGRSARYSDRQRPSKQW